MLKLLSNSIKVLPVTTGLFFNWKDCPESNNLSTMCEIEGKLAELRCLIQAFDKLEKRGLMEWRTKCIKGEIKEQGSQCLENEGISDH